MADEFESKKNYILGYFKDSGYYVHDYRKSEPRFGRKMGHINYLGSGNPSDIFYS
jgi:phosphoribosylaminoimidazole carboxylase (NCAIR synthetase)